MDVPVPLLDIAPWHRGDRTGVPAALDAALRTPGFLLVVGHGVPDTDRAAVRRAARRFFALPAGTKAAYAVAVGARGWLPPGVEANAAAEGVSSPPDLKETFAAGADSPTGDPPSTTSGSRRTCGRPRSPSCATPSRRT